MKRYNVIAIFTNDLKYTLMCKRKKEPFKNLYNFVGGKVENDNSVNEAYRELFEETGISKNDIVITHLMDFIYYKHNIELEVYYGILNNKINLIEEVNKLEWISMKENFFDYKKFAGNGNIGHIMKQIMLDIETYYE